MDRDSLLRMVLAQRATLEALMVQNEAIVSSLEATDPRPASAPAGCQHPPHQREDTTTGGGSKPSFFCRGCNRTSEEIEAEKAGPASAEGRG